MRLADFDGIEYRGPRTVRVAGRFAAFDDGFGFDRGTSDAVGGVAVWDIRARRRRGLWSFFIVNLGDRSVYGPRLTDLVLSPSGRAAFVIDDVAERRWRVHRLSPGHRHVVLDRGPGVVAGSLRRSPGRVRWRGAGGVRSARL